MKTKEYAMREMVIDQCLGTGREYTREALQEAVNKALQQRGMQPVTSKATILSDLQEMNEKFYSMYEEYGIVAEKRGRLYYYRYRTGIDSIYNRELTAEEVEKLQEVRSLLQGLRGMPHLEWIDQMSARFDQQLESLGDGRCRVTMDLMLNPELEREILSYGEHLRVVSPEALRQRMAKLMDILKEEYQENDD